MFFQWITILKIENFIIIRTITIRIKSQYIYNMIPMSKNPPLCANKQTTKSIVNRHVMKTENKLFYFDCTLSLFYCYTKRMVTRKRSFFQLENKHRKYTWNLHYTSMTWLWRENFSIEDAKCNINIQVKSFHVRTPRAFINNSNDVFIRMIH